MRVREMVNGELEIRGGLDNLLNLQTLREEDLLTLAEARGIDLGASHKPRLNYLVALGILRKPRPAQYGKGKGGTRFFQRDTLECLEYIQGQRQDFALNEIKDIVIQRRHDLIKKASRELNINADIPEPSSIMKAARADVNKQCHFGYALIKADALLLKLGVLHELLMDAEAEIAALKSFYENLGGVLCENCRPEVEHYIKDKEEQVDELLVILKKDLETGKNLLKDLGE